MTNRKSHTPAPKSVTLNEVKRRAAILRYWTEFLSGEGESTEVKMGEVRVTHTVCSINVA